MFKKCTLTCPWIQWHRHRPSSLSVFGSRCRHLNCGQPTDSLRLHSRLRAVLRHVNSTAVSFWTCDVCQDVVDGGWISTWMAMTIQQKVGAGICKNHVSAPRPPNKKNRFQIWERRAGGRGFKKEKRNFSFWLKFHFKYFLSAAQFTLLPLQELWFSALSD